MSLPPPPSSDADVPRGSPISDLPGLMNMHVHFRPEPVIRKLWAYVDRAQEYYGTPWPITYRFDENTRCRLRVPRFAPLVYPHESGMAAWLTDWALECAARTPAAVPTATLYPEPGVIDYLGRRSTPVRAASRCACRSAASALGTLPARGVARHAGPAARRGLSGRSGWPDAVLWCGCPTTRG